jgi:DNA-binding transcriptional ArsR family regulator
MSTTIEHSKLSKTLFGKTRRAVLSILYSHTAESFYLRQLVRITGVGLGAMQRELKQLTDAGIIQRSRIGRQVFFQANSNCPVFKELREIVIKTIGVGDVLLAGDITFAEVVSAISPLQETLSREINPSVYPLNELKSKISEGHHFISTVLEAPKIFIIGDNKELEKLVAQ